MQQTTLDRFCRDARSVLRAAQQERVLVLEDGKPCALVVG